MAEGLAATHSSRWRAFTLLALATLVVGCSSRESPSPATGGAGGSSGSAGNSTNGGTLGGSTAGMGGTLATGGDDSGGTTALGGTSGDGGSPESGTGGGGGSDGGTEQGGSSFAGAGGAATGGSAGTAGGGGVPTGMVAIYFVDVEGGQSTVMRLPDGQVFVVDTGTSAARDGDRIQAVLRDELGVTSVDYLLTTHYDVDHVGGATSLNERTPVHHFLDHGDEGAPSSYLTMANAGTRRTIRAGETLDLGDVHFDFVSSAGELITTPLPGGAENPHCADAVQKGESDENQNSVGFVLRFGSFDFVDLGDLLWDWELRLACPTNLLGPVDLYLTTHHGLTRSGAPPLVLGIAPLAAIMNNGPRKGGGGATWTTLSQAPGGMNVWQLHQALAADASENAPPDQIANLTDGTSDTAYFLTVTASGDGAFTVRNPRTSVSRAYQSR